MKPESDATNILVPFDNKVEVRCAALKTFYTVVKMFEMTHRSLLSSKKFLKASRAIGLFNYSGVSCFSRTYHT